MMTGLKATRCFRWMSLIGLALAFLSGCAAIPRGDPPSYGDWQAESAAPVDRIRFANLIDWQPLNRDWLLLRFNGGRSFAIRPRDPCMADVREARALELVSALPNLLHRSDQVRVDGKACLIEEIRSVSPQVHTDTARGSANLTGSR